MTPRKIVSEWRKRALKPGLVIEVQTCSNGDFRQPGADWDGSASRLSEVIKDVKIGDTLCLSIYRRFGRDDRELIDNADIRVHENHVELISGLD